MKIDLGDAAATAWMLLRRDRDALLALAGVFIFLPTLAMMLMMPSPPPAPAAGAGEAAMQLWASTYLGWLSAGMPWFLLVTVLSTFGSLSVIAFYLAPSRPNVGGAMAVAVRSLPIYALLMIGITLVAALGFLLFVLPGLWVLGRTMLTGAALVAEGGQGEGPVRRSIALTRGNGLVMAALAGINIFGVQLVLTPFNMLDEAMRGMGGGNPIAVGLVDIAGAAAAAVAALAVLLVQIAIYWRISGSSKGI